MNKENLERLILLNEECAEVQQIISKIIRHGKDSYHPNDPNTSNIQLLEKEISHLFLAVALLEENKDIEGEAIMKHFEDKANSIDQYLHYNTIPNTIKSGYETN